MRFLPTHLPTNLRRSKMNDQEELKMLREDLDTLTNLLQKMSQVIIDIKEKQDESIRE